jgi:hypothetical protein
MFLTTPPNSRVSAANSEFLSLLIHFSVSVGNATYGTCCTYSKGGLSCNPYVVTSRAHRSVSKPKFQSLVPIPLSFRNVILIPLPPLLIHTAPNPLFSSIQRHKPPPLTQHNRQRQSTDRNQHLIASIVVWRVISAVDLGSNQRPDLYDDVICGGGQCAFLHVERVFRDPSGENRVEIWV